MIERTMTSDDLPDWFTDLLLLRATDGLDGNQQKQFEQFVAEHPNRNHIESEIEKFELTVAAVDLSFQEEESDAALPDGLREKLLSGANRYWEEERSARSFASPTAGDVNVVAPKSRSGFSTREAMAWLTAAAAVVLLLTGLNPFAQPTESANGDTNEPVPVVEPLSIEERYEDFVSNNLDEGPAAFNWEVQGAFKEKGNITWSDSLQKGFMVFNGLRPNDPSSSQYQLWIFDKKRNVEFPVDGGVFDVAENGKTIVEIDARVPVTEATMFAITEEDPGGVVVSTRERLPLLAKVVATAP